MLPWTGLPLAWAFVAWPWLGLSIASADHGQGGHVLGCPWSELYVAWPVHSLACHGMGRPCPDLTI